MQQNKIPDGQRTKVIYTLIKDAKYQDVLLSLSRPSIIWAMSFSFAPEADLCPSSPTATIWAKISSTQLESTNSSLSSTRKSLSTSYILPKVITRTVISNKL